MTPSDPDMDVLDALFGEAKTQDVPQGLMGRVLKDALAEQPVATARVKPGFTHQVAALLGGWQGMGGLVAATCAGLWIGINPPASLPASLDTFLSVENTLTQQDPGLSGFGWDIEEG